MLQAAPPVLTDLLETETSSSSGRELRVWSATKDLCDKLNCHLVIIFGTNLLFPAIWCQSLKITFTCCAELRFRIKMSGTESTASLNEVLLYYKNIPL
ncbi:hypothetical protein TNCT_546221 [Trichonephila clavata]|uniref:Uncharacterized protein n=1 Tax=Trichonephila clavata TaxID=2740835 RepID=A0A8X6H3G1_TRICU|nr:hypothetical protein TNCT_546221 [Trichonephila clavata]